MDFKCKNLWLLAGTLLLLLSCGGPEERPAASARVSDYLSNRQVTCFAEDSLGYIWIGTARGLNRYNSEDYHQYFLDEKDSTSLPSNYISSLFVDKTGRLWVGTRNGASLYHPETDSFETVHNESTFDQVHQIWQDASGRVYFNMIEQLCAYNEDSGKMQVLIRHFDPSGEYGNECFITPDGNLWSITAHHIRCFDSKTLDLVYDKELLSKTSGAWMLSDSTIWIAFDSGLLRFNTATRQLLPAPSTLSGHPLMKNAPIRRVYENGSGYTLIATDKGIASLSGDTVIGQDNPDFPVDIPYRDITTSFIDSQGNLWCGTEHHGYFIRETGKTDGRSSLLTSFFKDTPIVGMTSSGDGRVWLLTADNRAYTFFQGSLQEFDIRPYISRLQPSDGTAMLYAGSDGYLWIVSDMLYETRWESSGLKTIRSYPSESIEQISVVTEDGSGNIWIGYGFANHLSVRYKGLSSFEVFELEGLPPMSLVYSICPLSPHYLAVGRALANPLLVDCRDGHTEIIPVWNDNEKKNLVTALYEDQGGKVWIGTLGSGLFRYDKQRKSVTAIDGMACKEVTGILEDGNGGIWVSTLSGLYRYNFNYGDFTAFGNESKQFSLRSSAMLQGGELAFGSSDGITIVHPGGDMNAAAAPLYFEDLYVDNQAVRWNPSVELRLGYNENTFSISYASPVFTNDNNIRYRYRLEGFEDRWIENRTNRTIQFTRLPAGQYLLKVQALGTERDGILSEASIPVIIAHAPWSTWWAYSLYALAVLLILGSLYWSRVNSIKQREAAKRAELEKEQEKRINQVNMSFFANISHEFRTPLTMISGPVTQMEKGTATPQMLSTVKWNVARMLRLVNQLMDFNKLENDTLKLQVAMDDVVALIKQTAAAYAFSIGEKGISFNGFGLEDSFTAWVDADKLDKILSNLLSNAMKFTPQGGEIAFSFDVVPTESGRWMKMVVADNGPKIPPESLERIFDRYYQVENHHNYGTGIGLYFARKLAELHHGSLMCENLAGEGLAFTLLLPADDVYTDSEKVDHNPEKLPIFLETAEFKTAENEGQHSQSVLIVDDDPDIVTYEYSLLAPQYNVRKAFNAQSALEMLRAEMPDVIISDVSMPGMDGYALCHAIKEDADICHIPVILVTAKTTVENQIEGLHQGADAYVTKPFDPEYLLAVIKSQLDNRERLRGILGKATTVEDIKEEEAALSPQDSALMKELYELMEKELDNDMLNINSITDQLHISRSKFYYKIRALTGENPNTFFKNYKLNRAKELLMDGRYNISEVADMTGFSNPSVFGRNFKARFGMTPTEWCNNQKAS